VGFAAESQDLLENAEAKRLRKKVPLLVGNIGPDTFGQDHNALLLVDEKGSTELPRASKLSLARQLVQGDCGQDGGRPSQERRPHHEPPLGHAA
jgi:phosphopantothenoylcysteine decarboxylase/phosphopantothenate--cysteine ligase